jgi:hypothetical protein
MTFSGMLRCVAVVRTDVSEELSASFFRVTSIVEIGTTPAVTSNSPTLPYALPALSSQKFLVVITVRGRVDLGAQCVQKDLVK